VPSPAVALIKQVVDITTQIDNMAVELKESSIPESIQEPQQVRKSLHGSDADISLFQSFYLGTVAAVIASTVVFPMDKIKTRLQSVPAKGSIFSTARNIVVQEGLFKLYRGLSPQLVMIGPVNAAQMAANDTVQRKFRAGEDRELTFKELLIAGMAAGVAEILLANPQEVIKIRMQMQLGSADKPFSSPIDLLRQVGFRGLYKGVGACALRDMPFNLIFFSSYDLMKRRLADKKTHSVSPQSLLFAGAASAVLGSTLSTPADVIKTRLQNGEHNYKSYGECVRHIYSDGGYSAFFRGLFPRLLIIAPMFGIQFMIFENLQKLFFKKHS
jgi:solute carrier family 25 aspartate/glutamate transporter 12/13